MRWKASACSSVTDPGRASSAAARTDGTLFKTRRSFARDLAEPYLSLDPKPTNSRIGPSTTSPVTDHVIDR